MESKERIEKKRIATSNANKRCYQIAVRFNQKELHIANACKKYMSDYNLTTTTFAKLAITNFLKCEGYLDDVDTIEHDY